MREHVPLDVPDETFFQHMHVVGGSGAGKTQWLQTLILHHLQKDDPPALVIVDSQGDLIRTVSSLALFDPDGGRLADKLIHITPKDTQYPPDINLFDVRRERVEQYDEATREQVVAGVIDLFDYLFRGILADLTAKQSVFFRMVARLMLAVPDALGRNATIMDILYLMEDEEPYRPAIETLAPVHRRFFERDFNDRTFHQTKEQIRYRLNAIIENPTLYRLFTSEHTKIDLFSELNRGSIILVDTAKDFLKSGSGYFGRIFISLVLQAVLERAAVPERDRKPAYLIVDEAADYFDANIDDLLTEARKYKLGCVFAHQYLGQCTQQLRSSLAANTSIKMASGVSTADARVLAPDLRTTQDFILAQPALTFACYIRGVTSQAIALPVTAGKMEGEPKLTDEARQILRANNRAKVSSGRRRERTADAEAEAAEPEPERDPTEATDEW
jgi:DNA helicase HerA-like ATPase